MIEEVSEARLPKSWNVKKCTSREELDGITRCMWRAFESPFHPWIRIVAPIFGSTAAGHEVALRAHQDRQWHEFQSEPASTWLYVADDESGDVIGAAEWKVVEVNPYANGIEKIDASWWPEGEERDFASMCMNQMNDPRMVQMNRPHTLLENMFVDPRYRRRGIGSALMRFGIDRATELGIESFIEASPDAKPLYEKLGYKVKYEGRINPEVSGPSDTWKRLSKELTEFVWFFMSRSPNDDGDKGNV